MSDTIDEAGGSVATLTKKDFTSDQEVRWCPGLRRLRDPLRRPGVHARARHRAAQDRVRERDRLQRPLHLLHGHLRGARDPRARAGDRDRHRDREPRPERVGRDRRRRRSLDRRQPPDPRAAAEREHQDPDVQQPDLRPHEGPVLADQRGGQGHEVDAVRLGRPPLQPDRGGARRRGRPSSPARSTTTASTSPRCCGRPPRTAAPRSSRSIRTATCSTTGRSTCCARSPRACTTRSDSSDGEPIIFDEGTQVRDRRRQRTAAGQTDGRGRSRSDRRARGRRAPVAPVRARAPVARPARGHLLRRVPRLRATGLRRGDARAARCAPTERLGKGDLGTLLHGGDTWTVG